MGSAIAAKADAEFSGADPRPGTLLGTADDLEASFSKARFQPVFDVDAGAGPDLRVVFLERASARLRLVKSMDLGLDEAVAGLIEPLEDIIGRRQLCECALDTVRRWEAADDSSRRRRRAPHRRAVA